MSDAVIADPRTVPRFTDEARKPVKKSQTQFPCRVTFCMAEDQIETLAQARKIYRASDSFMLRLAWDHFVRANHLAPITEGNSNGR
jgi:hypothetical protein